MNINRFLLNSDFDTTKETSIQAVEVSYKGQIAPGAGKTMWKGLNLGDNTLVLASAIISTNPGYRFVGPYGTYTDSSGIIYQYDIRQGNGLNGYVYNGTNQTVDVDLVITVNVHLLMTQAED